MRSPFHQDNFYWNISNKKALNVWIACSKASQKNGGMCYFKNLTKTVWLNIFCPKNRVVLKKSLKLILKKIKNKKFYPQLKAGDCIFHHCEVIHGSKKNTSNLDRIGLVISYKGLSAKIDKKTFKLQKL